MTSNRGHDYFLNVYRYLLIAKKRKGKTGKGSRIIYTVVPNDPLKNSGHDLENRDVWSPYSARKMLKWLHVFGDSPERDPGPIPRRVTPEFRMWAIVPFDAIGRRVFSGSPVYPTLSFRCCSILTSVTLIGLQDLVVKSRQNISNRGEWRAESTCSPRELAADLVSQSREPAVTTSSVHGRPGSRTHPLTSISGQTSPLEALLPCGMYSFALAEQRISETQTQGHNLNCRLFTYSLAIFARMRRSQDIEYGSEIIRAICQRDLVPSVVSVEHVKAVHDKPIRMIDVSMEQRRNERERKTGDPRENPPTNGIVRNDSHMRKSGVTRPGIEPT
ncbi:hypothetical protein PR048_008698 [Dryococelus australis]|uniref:Uncharacterized protein n=1 Tax=Dryococelus australis TaxID=614101 RepID=A0ABQ9HXU4_9NEOP|nr:hypothetical protein PR048_008698 [Dryococelus australis]